MGLGLSAESVREGCDLSGGVEALQQFEHRLRWGEALGTADQQALGRLDRNAADRAPPETRHVIEKGHDLVVASQPQNPGELGTGLNGAIDGHTHDLILAHRPQRQEQITQGKTHRSGGTGEKQPEQDHTAAERHRQTQHHGKARRQQHQQSIAASEAIESPATDIAREGFVLPGEGIRRRANQQHRWQQPKPGSQKAGMERMGQSQPEAEPHRQWKQQGVNTDQQQQPGERNQPNELAQ